MSEEYKVDGLLNKTKKLFLPEPQIDSLEPEDDPIYRGQFESKMDFLLTCVGFAVGLGNIWRFPFQVLANGGGSYIIAYLIMLITAALPIFFVELSIGQFTSLGTTDCWGFAPGFKGIGYAMLLSSVYCSIYYNTIIAWTFYYLFYSFYPKLPWLSCKNIWNDGLCVPSNFKGIIKSNLTGKEMSTEQFFDRVVTTRITRNPNDDLDPIVRHITDNWGGLNMGVTLALFVAWTLCALILLYGVRVSGKTMYFFALFPYIVIFTMIICGARLNGSGKGLLYYVKPVWGKLLKLKTWRAASEQIFFSVGIGFGCLLTFGSYSNFKGNIFRDVLIVGSINSGTSLVAAIAVFEIIGFMAYRYNTTIDQMGEYAGSGLIFIAYPEGLSLFPFQNLLLILFFTLILCLGVDSQLGLMECAITGILDAYPRLRINEINRIFVVIALHLLCFLISSTFTFKTGYYWFVIVSKYSASTNLLIIGLFESSLIAYAYGFKNYDRDIIMMFGKPICLFWKICLYVPVPIITIFLTIDSFITESTTTVGYGYKQVTLPTWCDAFGYTIFASTLVPIPYHFIKFIVLKINKDKMSFLDALKASVKPTIYWGPKSYRYWKKDEMYNAKLEYLISLGYVHAKSISVDTKGTGEVGIKPIIVPKPESEQTQSTDTTNYSVDSREGTEDNEN